MEKMGVEGNGGARRAASEKIDRAARPRASDGVQPHLRNPGGVDGYGRALTTLCSGTHHFRLAARASAFESFRRAQLLAYGETVGAGIGKQDPVPLHSQHRHEQQADGTGAEHHDLHLAGLAVTGKVAGKGRAGKAAGIDAVNHAAQGFRQGRLFEGKALGNKVGVALDEAFRDEQEFRVGAVDILKVLAQVFPLLMARTTSPAGGGIDHHHGILDRERGDAITDGGNAARHFVAEQGRHLKHAGVAAAPVDLDVGAAGGGRFHAEENFARPRPADRNLADFNPFRPQQHRATHCFPSVHYVSEPAREGVNRTFRAW